MQKEKIVKPIVSVSHLTCVFNYKQVNEVKALDDISFDFEPNKIHFIIGNSGSGKSTFVLHFNGLIKSKKGNLNIDNFKILEDKRKIKHPKVLRKKISMVFQFPEYQLFKDTIMADVSFGPKVLGIPKSESYNENLNLLKENIKENINSFISLFKEKYKNFPEINNEDFLANLNFDFNKKKLCETKKVKLKINHFSVDHIFSELEFTNQDLYQYKVSKFYLNKMGIDDSYFEKSPFGLSGGQKRRVAISGILSINPNILVFDEPTAGLDPAGEKEMMKIILDAKKSGKTVFVISHNMDHVLEIGDNVVVMDQGKIIAHGTPYDIFLNQDLITNTQIDQPKIIAFIESLIKKDNQYSYLLKEKPNTIELLAKSLLKNKNKEKK